AVIPQLFPRQTMRKAADQYVMAELLAVEHPADVAIRHDLDPIVEASTRQEAPDQCHEVSDGTDIMDRRGHSAIPKRSRLLFLRCGLRKIIRRRLRRFSNLPSKSKLPR